MEKFYVLYFDQEDWPLDRLNEVYMAMKQQFPNIVFLPKSFSLKEYNKTDLRTIQIGFNNIVNELLEEE